MEQRIVRDGRGEKGVYIGEGDFGRTTVKKR